MTISWGTAPAFVGRTLADFGRDIGGRVEARLRTQLATDRARYAAVAPGSEAVVDALSTAVLSGGKRLRPSLAYLSFLGAGGSPADPRIVDVGAALELLHAGCLVHDDIMDDSPTRRGLLTTHARYQQEHQKSGYTGEARRFGEGVGMIVGDMAFFYAIGLLRTTTPETQAVFFELAVDAGVGQYLDLLAAACPADLAPDPMTIARYKTGRYTVEGPLRLGAALAGRLVELGEALTAYGQPVGLAYQLRDDLLGAFGDPSVTGKPVGDDLRQGKRTLLLGYAKQQASGSLELLEKVDAGALTEAEVPAVQRLLEDLGAREYVESTCQALAVDAVNAIEAADIDLSVKEYFKHFAAYVAGA
ncbi:polyprenyl synthetase family protein [Amycolatopsis sp. cg5]|uniref:polyprenyl synthetase family protein n=1 Tax=Amycolatopsis sp. cg5 TaxID=3238802 RepID=UPI00352556E2